MGNQDKIQQLKETIEPMLDVILQSLAAQDKLDHFELELKNHKGDIQLNQMTKMRVKAY